MKNFIIKILAKSYTLLFQSYCSNESRKLRLVFGSIGENVNFGTGLNLTANNIFLGNNIHIGNNALFWCSNSKIIIKDYVVFGPNVTIMAGDHNTSIVGEYMLNVKIKEKGNDLDVIINEDVWVGCNTTILKGVEIGRGAVVAAGSVVVKNIPPYAIVGGIPAKVLKFRWNIETILKHEKSLYKPGLRLTKEQLEYK